MTDRAAPSFSETEYVKFKNLYHQDNKEINNNRSTCFIIRRPNKSIPSSPQFLCAFCSPYLQIGLDFL